jgi:hypothetical protein
MNGIQPLAHVEAKLYIEGAEYEVEDFKIGFIQAVDHKGQPQDHVRGGQILISLSQMVGDNIYEWATNPFSKKDGYIAFETGISNAILRVTFTQAYCIDITQALDAFCGLVTNLIITPSKVVLNKEEYTNKWISS